MASEESENFRATKAAVERKRLSDNARAEARVKSMVMAFHEVMKGQDRIDCIMVLYTLTAHWIYHMRPEMVPEDLAIDMVIRGIQGTLEQIRKEGIERGELDGSGLIMITFPN